ncbi:MAG TPA: MFS transporter [Deltaproteobacteria bacterium]|nr:MFS transporter [Deltaproteobacteria bacterium]HPR51475.1 MFS transporter [Deltaproteobacteria bacterium]
MTEATTKDRAERFQTDKVMAIAAVHFIHDIYTSFLAPILPLIIKKLGLSLTQAGSLTVFMQLPSLFNPFLGTIADRRGLKRQFLIASPAVTATIMCLIGLVPSFGLLCATLLAVGISVAALHVSAPVITAQISGKSIGRGMSFFMVGGELARTAGPLVAVWAVSNLGMTGMWQLMFVGWAASAVLWWRLRRTRESNPEQSRVSLSEMLMQMKVIITGVFGIQVARAFMASAITTYLPTFLFNEGHSLWFSGISLSIFEGAGVVGVFVSGTLSDRIGRRRVLLAAALLSPAMMFALLFSEGTVLFIVLLLLGFSTLATGPVLMAVMMENAGSNRAAANGTYMAINFAVRATIILVIGAMSDALGMRGAFMVCAGVACIGIPFIALLPKSGNANRIP